MAAIVSTASVPAAERFDYWRDAVCNLFTHLDLSVPQEGRAEFSGLIIGHASGRLSFAQISASAHRVVHSEHHLACRTRDSFKVLVQRAGLAIVEQDGR